VKVALRPSNAKSLYTDEESYKKQYIQLLTPVEVDTMIYQPEVDYIFPKPEAVGKYHLPRVDNSFYRPQQRSILILLYDNDHRKSYLVFNIYILKY